MPSSRSNSQARVCFANSRRCSRLASRATTLCRCCSCWSSRWRSRPSSSASHSWAASPAGIVVAGARHHLAIGLGGAVILAIGLGAVGRIAIHRRLRPGGGAFAAVGLVLAVLFLALALVVIG